ncbi:hypothetical protein [Winogradskyella tangerina]|uniref:hypothetical protein n=1 Tax=Winogradskyella tangerina TaxID=2023240 RepID=UPI000DBE20FF|nr:hypothetical protein [Winogradskyella tangerina]
MFKLFRKKNKNLLSEIDFLFLEAISNKLENHNFLPAINKSFIVGKRKGIPSEGEDSFTYIFNKREEHKYIKKEYPNFFIIKNINAFEKGSKKLCQIEICILTGYIINYLSDIPIENIDLSSIDTSKSYEKHFDTSDSNELKLILGKVPEQINELLDINETFKIEIVEGEFYVIKDLEDGNYLSMNSKGEVFGMIHDPYEIEKLFDNKDDFFDALKRNEFNIDEYYDKKML